jgi:hypothetical protein
MSRTHTKVHKTGQLKKKQKIQKIQKKGKKTLKNRPKKAPKRTLKGKKSLKGGNITDLWGRDLPNISNSSTLGDFVNGIENPCFHGKDTF